MPTVLERVDADLKTALKGGDAAALRTLRLLRSSFHNAEIALQKRPLPEADAMKVIRSELKRRAEAAEAFSHGGRTEQAKAEREEAAVLERYLPPQLGEAELAKLIAEVVAKHGAIGPAELGKVMKLVMAEVGNRASGKVVSDLVRKTLAGP